MPRGVNLIVLLGIVIAAVLSFGLSAGARPEGAQRAQAGSELERLQKEAEAANGAYNNTLDEENRLNNEIAQKRSDLSETENRLAETQSSLGDRAEEVYKHGDLGLMDALTWAGNVKDFSDMFGLLTQQLGQDQSQVQKLREDKDSLQRAEQDLQSQVEDRKATLDDEAAKKDEAQRAIDEAQAAFDALKPEDRQKIKEQRTGRVQDALKGLRGTQEAPGVGVENGAVSDPRGAASGGTKDNASGLQGEATRGGAGNRTSDPQGEVTGGGSQDKTSDPQRGTPEGESGNDQALQVQLAQAIDQTINEWIDQGKLPARDGSAGSDGPTPDNPVANLATNVAQKQAEADRQARETADQVTAEQEAQKKAADQTRAAEDAKSAAEQAPAEKQTEARTAADDVQHQADLAAKDAAAQKAAARDAADQAVAQKQAADQAATQLASEASKPQAGLPVEASGNGALDAGTKLVVPGDFSIAPGSTVTYEDADGTRGTATDGINAKIVKGSIDTTLTGPLSDVSGGDGQMSANGLKIADTTGITVGPGEAGGPQAPSAGPQPASNAGPGGPQPDPNAGAEGIAPKPEATGQPGLQPALGQSKLKPAPSGSGGGVVGTADTWLGVPYVHGGDSRAGIDCSAFTAAVYAKFGIILPDSPAGQWAMGTPVTGPPKAGDLVFFSEDGSGVPTHVGIADGKGNVIHASDYFMDVTVTPIDNITGYMGAKRLL